MEQHYEMLELFTVDNKDGLSTIFENIHAKPRLSACSCTSQINRPIENLL